MPKERYTVRLSEPVASAVTSIAEEEDRPFAQVVDLLLAERLGLRPQKVTASPIVPRPHPVTEPSVSVLPHDRPFKTDFKPGGAKK